MLGGHRSPGVVPPAIYTKQPRFCSLPTLYRTPIECNIRYAFSLLITVHSNIEMKDQSSQLGYSWHDFLYACLCDLSVGLSMLSASHHSFRLQRGASAGSRRRWSRCRRSRRCRCRRRRGRRLKRRQLGHGFGALFFSRLRRGEQKDCGSDIFLFGIYKLSFVSILFFWKGS